MASLSLRLPDEVTQRLEQLAAPTGRSKTFYMVCAAARVCAEAEFGLDAVIVQTLGRYREVAA